MTRDIAKKILKNFPILQAYADGETVQLISSSGSVISTDEELDFTSDPHYYRIKPAPVSFWIVTYRSGSNPSKDCVANPHFDDPQEAQRWGEANFGQDFIRVVRVREVPE